MALPSAQLRRRRPSYICARARVSSTARPCAATRTACRASTASGIGGIRACCIPWRPCERSPPPICEAGVIIIRSKGEYLGSVEAPDRERGLGRSRQAVWLRSGLAAAALDPGAALARAAPRSTCRSCRQNESPGSAEAFKRGQWVRSRTGRCLDARMLTRVAHHRRPSTQGPQENRRAGSFDGKGLPHPQTCLGFSPVRRMERWRLWPTGEWRRCRPYLQGQCHAHRMAADVDVDIPTPWRRSSSHGYEAMREAAMAALRTQSLPSSAAETNPFIAGSVRVGLNLREGGWWSCGGVNEKVLVCCCCGSAIDGDAPGRGFCSTWWLPRGRIWRRWLPGCCYRWRLPRCCHWGWLPRCCHRRRLPRCCHRWRRRPHGGRQPRFS